MQQMTKEEPIVNMAGKCFFAQSDQTKWIVDSGATNHITTSDKSLLLHDDKVENAGNVLMPTGATADVSHIGNFQLTGGDLLKDVLCVPTFKLNLLSVSKVTKDLNYCAKFFPEHCVFQDLCTRKVKVTGREEQGLYILTTPPSENVISGMKSLSVIGDCDPELWHKRLGHVPMSVLRKIPVFNNSSCFYLQHCDVCPRSKQTILPFPTSSTRSVETFQLIHLDVRGPYHVDTQNGMKYFLTVIDDFSK